MSTTTLTPTAVAADARPTQSTSRAAWLGFLVVLIASVMDLLDSTIAQTAAPAIRRDLGGSYASLEWISAAYTLAMAVTLLLGSRLGDILGRRRVLCLGLGGFVAASTLCALAPTAQSLIAARALQGVTAAIMVPRRAIFLVNVPLGMVALVAARRYLPRTAPATPGARPDALSALLLVIGGVAIVYPLIQGREHGWPLWSFALLAVGVIILGTFALVQARQLRHGRSPLIEPSILRRRPYVAGLAVVLGFIGAMGGMIVALNVMLQTGLGFSPLACGVATIAIPVAAIGGSITSSALLARLGRTTMHIGIATMAIGLVVVDLVLRSAGGDVSAWQLAAPLALTGWGMGMVFVPMFDVILAGVASYELGSASGLLESVQQLAMALGLAAVGTVLFDTLGAGRGPAAFVVAADHGLWVAVGFLVVAGIAVCWLPRHARPRH